MSTWNIGANDVSQETQNYRNKLSSKGAHYSPVVPISYIANRSVKDTQIAAQQSKLIKQAAELGELKQALNDALHKVGCIALCRQLDSIVLDS
jgi:myosin protein heavy chain